MEFTIKETFSYFGRLLKIKPDLVASRQAELLKLLQLGEEEDRQVGANLSTNLKGWLAIAKLKPLSLFISILSMLQKALDNVKIEK